MTALVGMRVCADSPESSLLDIAISTKLSHAGSYKESMALRRILIDVAFDKT